MFLLQSPPPPKLLQKIKTPYENYNFTTNKTNNKGYCGFATLTVV